MELDAYGRAAVAKQDLCKPAKTKNEANESSSSLSDPKSFVAFTGDEGRDYLDEFDGAIS
jgi:hypothetical protein